MSANDMRELDAWIAEKVMEFKIKNGRCWVTRPVLKSLTKVAHVEVDFEIEHYTTDPAAAMEVWKKCAEKQTTISIQKSKSGWRVVSMDSHSFGCETLELAICLFAKKLFEK
jgi:hypothetical protein